MTVKKVAGNVTIQYGVNGAENALTTYLNTSSLNAVVNAITTTNFGSTAETQIAGLATWTMPVGGPWDPTLDGYLGPDMVTPPTTLRTLIAIIDTVQYKWTSNAFISDYTVDASSPADGITWSGNLTCSGAPVRS